MTLGNPVHLDPEIRVQQSRVLLARNTMYAWFQQAHATRREWINRVTRVVPRLPPCLLKCPCPLQQGPHGDAPMAELDPFPPLSVRGYAIPDRRHGPWKLAQYSESMTMRWKRDRYTEPPVWHFKKSWPDHRGAGVAQAASLDTTTCRGPEHACAPSTSARY